MGPPAAQSWNPVRWGDTSVVYVVKSPNGGLVSTNDPVRIVESRRSSSSSGSSSSSSSPTHHAALGQFRATSIAGNDLLSSCLYTAGICAGYAGKMAPLSLLLVSVMLYFFRFVYSEVVTALALNGGSYTALANTTSKRIASLAACLSIISYVATAVVSALSAVNYIQLLWPEINNHTGELIGTVVVLAIFAALNLLGMSESANVAITMFIIHFLALTLLMVWSFIYACQNKWQIFIDNLSTPYPENYSWPLALYYGYAAAMLGITGFETAANYVEEMKDGKTYVRVLRNMWWSVAIFNPVLGFLAMAVLPMSEMTRPDYASNLLGPVAQKVGGDGFQAFICVDGFIVLCGSVLTAFVGIGGLLKRLALDRCLPDILLATNKLRGTNHWIILTFFGVSSSLFLALDGDVDMLGSVYNIAFLSVMTAFAISCIILKWKRPLLPRMVVSSGFTVGSALVLVILGLIGNIVRAPEVLEWFLLYFGTVVIIVFTMFNRTVILKALIVITGSLLSCGGRASKKRKHEESLLIASHQQREHEAYERLKYSREKANNNNKDNGDMYGESTQGSWDTVVGLDLCLNDNNSSSLSSHHPSPLSPKGSLNDTTNITNSKNNKQGRGLFSFSLKKYDNYDQEEGGTVTEQSTSSSISAALLENSTAPLDDRDHEYPDPNDNSCQARIVRYLGNQLEKINSRPYIFFAKVPDFETLNKAILYVRSNEQTSRIIVVHVVNDTTAVTSIKEQWIKLNEQYNNAPTVSAIEDLLVEALPPLPLSAKLLREQVAILDTVYPKIRIDYLVIRGTSFGPGVIRWLEQYLMIGTNSMFIAMPDATFPHQFASLGGVRVVTRSASKEERRVRDEHVLELLKGVAHEWQS